MKLKERSCKYRDCPNKHKSTTGYCVDHAHMIDQRTTARMQGTRYGADRSKQKPKHGLGG